MKVNNNNKSTVVAHLKNFSYFLRNEKKIRVSILMNIFSILRFNWT